MAKYPFSNQITASGSVLPSLQEETETECSDLQSDTNEDVWAAPPVVQPSLKPHTSTRSSRKRGPRPARPIQVVSPRWLHVSVQYVSAAKRAFDPPSGLLYLGLPFFRILPGDVLEILEDGLRPPKHPGLPTPIDGAEGGLLLVRDQDGHLGWVLASFLHSETPEFLLSTEADVNQELPSSQHLPAVQDVAESNPSSSTLGFDDHLSVFSSAMTVNTVSSYKTRMNHSFRPPGKSFLR